MLTDKSQEYNNITGRKVPFRALRYKVYNPKILKFMKNMLTFKC